MELLVLVVIMPLLSTPRPRQLHVPQYPIPLPEDVFLKLRGGQRFTKLDLKSAYQQLPLPLQKATLRKVTLRYCVFTRSVPAHYGHHPSGFRSCGEYTR